MSVNRITVLFRDFDRSVRGPYGRPNYCTAPTGTVRLATLLKYEVKLLSYSVDSLKTIIQTIEMNTSHIPSNSVQQNIIDIQELKWPISNTTQLDEIKQLLMDTNMKNNEVYLSDSYMFMYNNLKNNYLNSSII